jgi:outer membrane protein OmpA-like peptidoglycan-associated protein
MDWLHGHAQRSGHPPGWRLLIALITLALLLGACSTSADPGQSTSPAPIAPSSVAADSDAAAPEEPTLPPGATPGLDDLNGDGQPDPTCSNQDYGGGLVVRIPCNYADYAADAAFEGTQLVPNSLLGLPGAGVDLTGVSGSAVQGRTASGQKLIVLFISADTLFKVGSASLTPPATVNFDAIAHLIQDNWPNGQVWVRGHTDATGSATANQHLSEQRATTVASHLAMRGIDDSRLRSVGLGSNFAIVLETNPDGSDNPTGREHNRRVELAIILP